jgi:hypothetical protein
VSRRTDGAGGHCPGYEASAWHISALIRCTVMSGPTAAWGTGGFSGRTASAFGVTSAAEAIGRGRPNPAPGQFLPPALQKQPATATAPRPFLHARKRSTLRHGQARLRAAQKKSEEDGRTPRPDGGMDVVWKDRNPSRMPYLPVEVHVLHPSPSPESGKGFWLSDFYSGATELFGRFQ